jgi:uncharacterized membrane protein (UPF0127 family)
MIQNNNEVHDWLERLGARGILTIVVFILILVATLLLNYQQYGFGRGKVVIDGQVEVTVEIAASEATRERGLSGRVTLVDDSGMLFLFNAPARYTFWMKEMRFPIDVLWIRDGKIVDLAFNIQPLESDQTATRFSPLYPADAVLEVPAGFAARHGLRLDLPVKFYIDKKGAIR